MPLQAIRDTRKTGSGSGRAAATCIVPLALAFALWPPAAQAGGRLGDFGRPEPSIVTDHILPWLGGKLAARRGEPVSAFQLTDHEMELRARAYYLFMPSHRVRFFARHRAELVRARVWPDEKYQVDPTRYYDALRAQGFISSAARYNAIEQSVRADLGLIEPFMVEVERVYADDRRRMEALARASVASPDVSASAEARIYENRRVVDWAIVAMQWRVEAYSYALEATSIETPSIRAVDVEMALKRLAAAVDIMTASVDRLEGDGMPPAPSEGSSADRPLDLIGPVYKR